MPRKKVEGNDAAQTPPEQADPPLEPLERHDAYQDTQERNLPVQVIRFGVVKGLIWKNLDEQGRCRYGVSFQRLYRTPEGEWAISHSFSARELLALAQVAEACWKWIVEQYANGDTPF
jgi:hypothetical protein